MLTDNHRRRTVRGFGVALGAVTVAATAVPAARASASGPPPVPLSASRFSNGDAGVLNFALLLEYVQAEFYAKGVAGALLGNERKYVAPIAAHEAAHVQLITSTLRTLGAQPLPKPEYRFPDNAFTDRETFLQTAATFEDMAAKAYQGQVARIGSRQIFAAAAAIAGIESRHAAVVALLLGKKPVPAPLENQSSMEAVLTAFRPFVRNAQ